MPYWFVVLHDAFANFIAGFMNWFVFTLESQGLEHDVAVNFATDGTVLAITNILVMATHRGVAAGWNKLKDLREGRLSA